MQSRLFSKPFLAALLMPLFLLASAAAWADTPISDADVSLEKSPRGQRLSVKSDEEGFFSFDKLKAGTYILHLGPLAKQRAARPANAGAPITNESNDIHIDILIRSDQVPSRSGGIAIRIGKQSEGRVSGRVLREGPDSENKVVD